MVRERKHQTGASNLASGRSDPSQQNNASVNNFSEKSTFTRAWAHTMIAPDEYKQKELAETKRSLKLSATWKPKSIYERDFETVHSASYTDLRNVKVHEGVKPKSLEEIAADNARTKNRQEAVDNMCRLVRGAYGTVATMLRTVSSIFYFFSAYYEVFTVCFFCIVVPQEAIGQRNLERIREVSEEK